MPLTAPAGEQAVPLPASPAKPVGLRLVSLDAYRGFVMLLMAAFYALLWLFPLWAYRRKLFLRI